ncbi:MAG: hypothetical protein LUQ40_06025 [Methanomicrobiales archaeon]|nr:hypothetical protein [Methanomicrobiales archaeon]
MPAVSRLRNGSVSEAIGHVSCCRVILLLHCTRRNPAAIPAEKNVRYAWKKP